MANIYAEALKAKGVDVSTNLNIGSREVYLKALQDGSISLLPEYTGNLLQYFDTTATASSPDDVFAALVKANPGRVEGPGQVRRPRTRTPSSSPRKRPTPTI